MKFIFSGTSKKNKRPENQDSLYIKSGQICGIPSLLAIVCDGVGSLKNGELAGIIAVAMMKSWFAAELQEKISADKNIKNSGKYLIEKIQSINQKIIKISASAGIKTATTLSAVLIIGTQYFMGHIGDSRIYKINSAGAFQMTEDHKNTESNALTRCLGYANEIESFYAEGILKESDSFLLCSDGFYQRTNMAGMQKRIKNIKNNFKLLKLINKQINTVIQNGEQDNISLAVIKIV